MKLLLALVVAGGLQYRTGSTVLAVVAGVLAYAATCWRLIRDELGRKPKPDRWWAQTNLVDAFIAAGILPAPKAGEPRPVLSYRGRPEVTDAGVGVTIGLPKGVPFQKVAANRAQLAAAMPVPLKHLQVTQRESDLGNVVRLWVGAPAKEHARSHLATTERTSWLDPVRIGVDDRGRPSHFGTFQENTVVSGAPGSGKTTLGRLFIGHYLLDPETLIFGLDGKGSRKDYGDVAKLAVRWVWGGRNEQAGEETLAMLKAILDLVRTRNEDDEHGAKVPPGVLLVLEEFQDIRTSTSKEIREEIDAVLGQVVRMARAVAFHVLISTQRPSVDDLPSGFRNLITQRAALKLPVVADAKLVLGHTPALPIPTRIGEAIVGLPDGDRAVVVDYLDGADWIALCRRAAKLRAAKPELAPATRELPVEQTVEQPLGLLESLVVEILLPGDLSPTDLLAAVQGRGVQTNATALGRAVGEMERVERVKTAAGRVVRLSESGRREIGSGNLS